MDHELAFSIAGLLAMAAWATLLASPFIPVWSDRFAGLTIPIILSVGYLVLALRPNENGGGFGSLADVSQLFGNRSALLAGWIHFLAFDLLIGAWICRTARNESIRFWWVLPCLPLTFLFGPAGFLLFSGIRCLSAATASRQRRAIS